MKSLYSVRSYDTSSETSQNDEDKIQETQRIPEPVILLNQHEPLERIMPDFHILEDIPEEPEYSPTIVSPTGEDSQNINSLTNSIATSSKKSAVQASIPSIAVNLRYSDVDLAEFDTKTKEELENEVVDSIRSIGIGGSDHGSHRILVNSESQNSSINAVNHMKPFANETNKIDKKSFDKIKPEKCNSVPVNTNEGSVKIKVISSKMKSCFCVVKNYLNFYQILIFKVVVFAWYVISLLVVGAIVNSYNCLKEKDPTLNNQTFLNENETNYNSVLPKFLEAPCFCENGIANFCQYPHNLNLEISSSSEQNCHSCSTGYYLSNSTCHPNICYCHSGQPLPAGLCPKHETISCQSCKAGFHLEVIENIELRQRLTLQDMGLREQKTRANSEIFVGCLPNVCYCENGVPVGLSSSYPNTGQQKLQQDLPSLIQDLSPNNLVNDQILTEISENFRENYNLCQEHNSNSCWFCHLGYHFDKFSKTCQKSICFCENGSPSDVCLEDLSESCSSCDENYILTLEISPRDLKSKYLSKSSSRVCKPIGCKCPNGIPFPSNFCEINGQINCSGCHAGFSLNDNNHCQANFQFAIGKFGQNYEGYSLLQFNENIDCYIEDDTDNQAGVFNFGVARATIPCVEKFISVYNEMGGLPLLDLNIETKACYLCIYQKQITFDDSSSTKIPAVLTFGKGPAKITQITGKSNGELVHDPTCQRSEMNRPAEIILSKRQILCGHIKKESGVLYSQVCLDNLSGKSSRIGSEIDYYGICEESVPAIFVKSSIFEKMIFEF